MAITTLTGAIAGLQPLNYYSKSVSGTLSTNRWKSLWSIAGLPTTGDVSMSTLNGEALSAPIVGAIDRRNPVSGNAYLARMQMSGTGSGLVMLVDKLWRNTGYTATQTTAHSITSPAWPARDVNGSTNGDGVLLAVECLGTMGAASPVITVEYTNQAGTTGRVGTTVFPVTSSSTIGSVYPIVLQGDDTGVRSVQSLTLSTSWISGTFSLFAYRPIAAVPLDICVPNAGDAISLAMPRIFNDSVLQMLFLPTTTTTSNIVGHLIETHG